MTEPKQPPAEKPAGELSEAELKKATGGALNAYKPGITDGTHSGGGGGGAGMGDGSVRTNNTLIGLN